MNDEVLCVSGRESSSCVERLQHFWVKRAISLKGTALLGFSSVCANYYYMGNHMGVAQLHRPAAAWISALDYREV